LNVLITAGGTRENIDHVRGITNYSTGRLGSKIAEVFLQNGAKVTYICGENSKIPMGDLTIHRIQNVAQLAAQMEETLKSAAFDCVIFSMAVSDYSPVKVAQMADLQDATAIFDDLGESGGKISSDSEYMAIILKRNPKIINLVKEIQPKTTLVGFKLLSNVSENELVNAGLRLLEKSRCDFVLANDLENITNTHHTAILLDSAGIMARAETKEEIAKIICEKVGGI
jgi:phosphopantothenate-cysteine ligase